MRSYDPLESMLPPPGQYRLTDGEDSIDIDTSNPELRQQYRQRYERQQQAFSRLCRELGLYQIDIATDDDMLVELKAGLGLHHR